MDFSDILKEIRKSLHLSQEDLARELGVSYATVNRWETGKNKPSKMAISAIMSCAAKNGMLDILKEEVRT